MLEIIEPWLTFATQSPAVHDVVATATDNAENVRYLAGLNGDGTSNGAWMNLVQKVIMWVMIGAAAAYVVFLGAIYIGNKGGGNGAGPGGGGGGGAAKSKGMLWETVAFCVIEGLGAIVWTLIDFAQSMAGGAVS